MWTWRFVEMELIVMIKSFVDIKNLWKHNKQLMEVEKSYQIRV